MNKRSHANRSYTNLRWYRSFLNGNSCVKTSIRLGANYPRVAERGNEKLLKINERLSTGTWVWIRTRAGAGAQGLYKCVHAYVHDFQSGGRLAFGENDRRPLPSSSFLSFALLPFPILLVVLKLVQYALTSLNPIHLTIVYSCVTSIVNCCEFMLLITFFPPKN